MKRLLRRAVIGVITFALVVTTMSLVYNAFTNEQATPPAGLKFVQAADINTRSCAPDCPALDNVDEWTRPFRQPGAEQALWEMVSGDDVPAVQPDRLAELHALPLPKSVVWGSLDTQGGNPTETAARIGAPPPTILEGAKHLTLISNPTEVTQAINRLAG